MKNILTGLLSLLVILPLITNIGKSQSIKRQSINSYSAEGASGKTFFSQTIGQPYSTPIYNNEGAGINPGFQQSMYLGNQKTDKNDLENKTSSNKDYQDLKIYPNPAGNIIHIETVIERGSLQVFNMEGEKILNKEILHSNSNPINCSDWPNGLYMILMYNKATQTNYSTKVLISK